MDEEKKQSNNEDFPQEIGAQSHSQKLPLSNRLSEALDLNDLNEPNISIGQFLNKIGDDSIHFLQVLVCLPFCLPAFLPGWGVVAGCFVIYSAFYQLREKPLNLPSKIRDKQISKSKFAKVLVTAGKFIGFLEKWISPRHVHFFEKPIINIWNGWLLILDGVLLWIPWPVIFPLSNFFPGIAIIFLSLCLMESDGRTIWIAYLLSFLSLIYTIVLIYLGKELGKFVVNFLDFL